MVAREDDPTMLDLSGFTEPEEAFRRACAGLDRYTQIARRSLTDDGPMRVAHMAFMAFVSRARGLHEGIVREIRQENPHAVFMLLRGMAELVTILLYTNQRPGYIETVVGIGPNRFKRKSFEAMFHALRDRAPGLKAVYAELSDYSHMGPGSVANAATPIDDDSRSIGWTDVPHWRSANDFRVACALTEEVVEIAIEGLGEFARLHLNDPAASAAIGVIGEHHPLRSEDLEMLRTLEEDEPAS